MKTILFIIAALTLLPARSFSAVPEMPVEQAEKQLVTIAKTLEDSADDLADIASFYEAFAKRLPFGTALQQQYASAGQQIRSREKKTREYALQLRLFIDIASEIYREPVYFAPPPYKIPPFNQNPFDSAANQR